MVRHYDLSPEAIARERSMLVGTFADIGIWIPYTAVAVLTGSLTMIAESVRGAFLIALEVVVIVLLRRIHRARLHDYEYGSGKIEQFTNMVVGLAMVLGAAWLGYKAFGRLVLGRQPPATGTVLMLGVVFSVLNLGLNIATAWTVWKAGRDGTSVIMIGQIRSRVTKVLSSMVVLAAVLVGTLDRQGPAGLWADVLGSLFVGLIMLGVAWSLWRDALPDLLDRSLSEERQAVINRALAAHFDQYEELIAVRSRRSGKRIDVEVELGLVPATPLSQADQLAQAIRGAIGAEIQGARVVVILRPTGSWPPRAAQMEPQMEASGR